MTIILLYLQSEFIFHMYDDKVFHYVLEVPFFGLTIATVHLALSEAGLTISRPPES